MTHYLGEDAVGGRVREHSEEIAQRLVGAISIRQGIPAFDDGSEEVRLRRQAATEWERFNGPVPDAKVFRREVLPLLAGVSAVRLAEATGLSRPYCAAILRGKRVAHPRWWGF